MPLVVGWLVFVYTLSLAITLGVFSQTAFRHWVPGTRLFSLIMFFEAIWIFGNICELLSPSLEAKLFWDNLQYLPTAAFPIGLLAFSLVYPNHPLRPILPWLAGLSLMMAAFLAVLFTNGFTAGLRPGARIETMDGLAILTYPFNRYDWVVIIFGYLIILTALALLLRTAIRQPAHLRPHSILILIGFGMPLLGTILVFAGIMVGPQRDHSPFFMAISNLLVWIGLVRFRLFDTLPLARVMAVEHIHEAIVVIDNHEHLLDLNPAAQALFGVKMMDIAGMDASQVLPAALPARLYSADKPETIEVALLHPGQPESSLRPFEISHRPIPNARGRLVGHLLVLHDMTERKLNEAIQRQMQEERIKRQSEAKFKVTIEQFTEGFVLVDQNGLVKEWNHAQETITGLYRSAVLGQPFWEVMEQLTVPERRSSERTAYFRNTVLDTIYAGDIYSRSLTDELIISADGKRKYIQQNVFPVRDGSDHWIGVATRDITSKKEDQLALERFVARLRILHEIDRKILAADQPDGVVAAVLDGLYQFLPFQSAGVILLEPLPDGSQWLSHAGEPPCFQRIPTAWLEYFQNHPENKFLLDFPCDPQPSTPECARCLGMINGDKVADQRLAVALRSQGRLLGCLHMCIYLPAVFTDEMIDIVTDAGDQLAIALQQETLREETQRRLHELTALHAIALLLNFQHSPNDPFGELTRQIAHLLSAQRCLLVQRKEDRWYEGYFPAYGLSQAEVAWVRWQALPDERDNDLWKNGYMIATRPEDIAPAARPLYIGLNVENLLAVSLWRDDSIIGLLIAMDKPGGFRAEDIQLLTVVATQIAQLITNTRLFQDLSNAYDATITGWSKALELRERETQNHSERVTALARRLALRMGMGESELEDFSRGVLLHDIGKMGIPDDILVKAGPLDSDQWEMMRQHPIFAYNLIKNITFLHNALDVPYCHHERWDGSGYPRGLRGEAIPLSARMFAVVDVWDALTNDRPYRSAISPAEAADFLRKNAGILFDPRIVFEFLSMMGE